LIFSGGSIVQPNVTETKKDIYDWCDACNCDDDTICMICARSTLGELHIPIKKPWGYGYPNRKQARDK